MVGLLAATGIAQGLLMLVVAASPISHDPTIIVWGFPIPKSMTWLLSLPPLSIANPQSWIILTPAAPVMGPFTFYVAPIYTAFIASQRRSVDPSFWRERILWNGLWLRIAGMSVVLTWRAAVMGLVLAFTASLMIGAGVEGRVVENLFFTWFVWRIPILGPAAPLLTTAIGALIGFTTKRPLRFALIVFALWPTTVIYLQNLVARTPAGDPTGVLGFALGVALLAALLLATPIRTRSTRAGSGTFGLKGSP